MNGHKQNLIVEIQAREIVVRMRGTTLRAAYVKGASPWLAMRDLASFDPDAPINSTDFRALAWEAANVKAREIGWIV
jgi:hypothetical protein